MEEVIARQKYQEFLESFEQWKCLLAVRQRKKEGTYYAENAGGIKVV